MSEIYLQLELAAARALHTGRPYPPADEVERAARALGLSLEPLHPGAPDELLPHFVARGAGGELGSQDEAQPLRALAALRQCRAVEAAYIKPPDEAP
jgi:hypothetical protein